MEQEQFTIDDSEATKQLFGGVVAYKNFDKNILGECKELPILGVPLNPCRRLLPNLTEDLKSKVTLPETTDEAQIGYFAEKATGKFWLGLFTADICKSATTQEIIGRCYKFMSDPKSKECQGFSSGGGIRWATGEPNGCDETYMAYRPEKEGDPGLMDLGSAQVNWKAEIICVYIASSISNSCYT